MPPLGQQPAGMPPMPPMAGGMPPMPSPAPSAPTAPAVEQTGDNAPMSPEHRAQLDQLIAGTKQGYSKWQSMKFGMQNKSNEFRKSQLREIFQELQAKGVDLNDQASVSAFLAKLKRTDPQNFEAVTRAIDYLLGTDYETQQNTGEPTGADQAPPLPGGIEGGVTAI